MLLYFPPTTGEHGLGPNAEPVQYDFNRLGFEGGDVAAELSKQIGVDVPYRAPFPWKFALTATLVAVSLTTLLIVVLPRLSSSQFNASGAFGVLIQVATLSTITVMCAGHMWNGIRGAPYMMMGQGGKPEYFASGFQNQYGAETQIVAIICQCLSSFLFLFAYSPSLIWTLTRFSTEQTACWPLRRSRLQFSCRNSGIRSDSALASMCGRPSCSAPSAFSSTSSASRSESSLFFLPSLFPFQAPLSSLSTLTPASLLSLLLTARPTLS